MFRRIANLFRGFLSLFIGGLERQNPEALLEVEKENLRRQIANYNQGLAAHAGLCERLMTQVKRLEQEERELRAKTAANLRAGNHDLASQQALRLQTVQRELVENQTQLGSAEATYKELLRARDVSVKAAQVKLESLKNSINDLKIKRATAELSEMASGMISQIGGSGPQPPARDGRGGARARLGPRPRSPRLTALGGYRHAGARTESAGRSGSGRLRAERRPGAGCSAQHGHDREEASGGGEEARASE